MNHPYQMQSLHNPALPDGHYGYETYAQHPKQDSNIYTTYNYPGERSHLYQTPPFKVFQHATESQQTLLGSSNDQVAPWKPGFFVQFPYLAVTAVLGGIACTALAMYLLRITDGVDIGTWTFYTPSVCLATLSVIANACVAYALVAGLVIAFWRHILLGGTMNELNRNWQCGNSAWDAIFQGFRSGGRLTAIARITTVLALFRGPLYQRASSIVTDHRSETQGSLSIKVAQYLPSDYAGISWLSRTTSTGKTARLTNNFTEILGNYSANTDLTLSHGSCGDSCSTTMKAFGFRSTCNITETSTLYNMNSGQTIPLFASWTGFFQTNQSQVLLSPGTPYYAGLRLNTTRFKGHVDSAYNGSLRNDRVYLTSHVCDLTFGVVEYQVSLIGNKVSLLQSTQDRFLEPVDLIVPSTSTGSGTIIGGFEYVSSLLFTASAIYNFGGAISSTTLTGTLANQMLINASSGVGYSTFADPMDTMLESIRNIAFRAALKAGSEGNDTFTKAAQDIPYVGYRVYSIYRTDYIYMFVAVGLSLLSLLSICATMYGWWQLGRGVSMSPFEIAKAFDAPLLRAAGSNSTYQQYPDNLKCQRIRYGARVNVPAEKEYLLLDLETQLRRPKDGIKYA